MAAPQRTRHTMGIGIPELVIILIIIILIFGANRLPEIGRGIGKGIRNFKDATKDGKESNLNP
jgi:sec-independent protein translocase protein TatA